MSEQRKTCTNCKYGEVCNTLMLTDKHNEQWSERGYCDMWIAEPTYEPCICERVVEAVIGLLRRALDAAEFKLLDLIWKWIERH